MLWPRYRKARASLLLGRASSTRMAVLPPFSAKSIKVVPDQPKINAQAK